MRATRRVNPSRAMVGSQLWQLEADNAEAMLDLEREALHDELVQSKGAPERSTP